LEESHENVRDLLTAKVEKLHTLAHALLENETIEQPDLKNILGPRPENSVNILDLAKETYR
jgi:ATP-dependent Zn protease